MNKKADLSKLKELRETTGLGFTQCKTALDATNWDTQKAEDYLRVNGSYSKKLDSRNASEGAIFVWAGSFTSITMIHLACETDFVAQSSVFSGSGIQIAKIINEEGFTDTEGCANSAAIQDAISDIKSKVKENVVIKDFYTLEGSHVAHYIHSNNSIGVLVDIGSLDVTDDGHVEFAQNICLQIAACAPVSLSKEDVPEDVLEREKNVFRKQLKGMEGKPEHLQEKILLGKLGKFFKESCLLDQVYVKESGMTVQKYVDKTNEFLKSSLVINGFKRFSK